MCFSVIYRALTTASPKDLAAGLQTAVEGVAHIPKEITMENLIDSWSTKAGYPLVTVSRDETNKITFKQTKFSYKVETDADEKWIIPINMATASSPSFDDTKPMVWLTEPSAVLEPETEPETRAWTTDDWIVVNIQETGFYRVNYDDVLWNQIVIQLNSDKFTDIHEFNRAQLVDDILNLARANIKDYSSVFRLLEYLKKEQNFVPWASASSGLRYLQRQLLGSESYAHFNRFVKELVSPLFAELGSHDGGENEKLADKHARTIAIDWACRTGDAKCISDTQDRVRKVIEDPSQEIEPDVRYIVYCNGLREATDKDYEAIMKRLNEEQDQGERTILINALGCIQVSEIQKKFLASSIADDSPVKYRIQERNRVLQGVYSNGQTGLENAMEFIAENHAEIQSKYNPPSPVKTNVITMSERVTSTELNTKFEELMETLTTAKYFTEEEKEKVLETPKENIAWTEKNEGEIRSFFRDYYKDAATVPIVSTLFLGMLLVISYLLQ